LTGLRLTHAAGFEWSACGVHACQLLHQAWITALAGVEPLDYDMAQPPASRPDVKDEGSSGKIALHGRFRGRAGF